MTDVLILGTDDDPSLRAALFEYETARRALSTYDVRSPYANTVAVTTVSLGAAVSLLNDLNWYLARLADAAMVRDPSVAEHEWLSRDVAARVRAGDLPAAETDARLKLYGIVDGALVEPIYATREGDEVPAYDRRAVDDTLPVRVTAAEFQ
ncbi:DUF5804 family protein [Halobacterium salinarum]|uniref:Uncharacterized protein n=1 Tax=Halobacterium salinarum (strain ATCC 33171 / DSM 3754 / JCM 8978 / NBRC 102687 / NCIMB 764 / 91-R6) TaxID=2597657 RepID=A0A4D6GVH8_HALS9|nr:DUF5804 family protein [Halobacterium salinarum]MDL0131201.1 DUF5804 family protein [Halobacterium salinarum]MDL0137883.1 DUF5804 family protein [Halobacterium salinarum]MDL0145991.1 DUF5804 family protein [Halobacterium salinarum]QCC45096.1 uncharacterized protein HBSAL_07225 [Halobacterium salinarum]TYO76207.1 hypothetical protein APQ99_01764 [Halobacterium salinarum DSM 3754]